MCIHPVLWKNRIKRKNIYHKREFIRPIYKMQSGRFNNGCLHTGEPKDSAAAQHTRLDASVHTSTQSPQKRFLEGPCSPGLGGSLKRLGSGMSKAAMTVASGGGSSSRMGELSSEMRSTEAKVSPVPPMIS